MPIYKCNNLKSIARVYPSTLSPIQKKRNRFLLFLFFCFAMVELGSFTRNCQDKHAIKKENREIPITFRKNLMKKQEIVNMISNLKDLEFLFPHAV